MPAPNSISIEKLSKLIGTPTTPDIVDVRIAEDFAKDPRILPASVRMVHNSVDLFKTSPSAGFAVVVCQAGAKLSHGAAAVMRLQGIDAVTLEGGFEAWQRAGMPLVPFDKIGLDAGRGVSRWVTRHRPKIDRIACPWLIRRFVDVKAEFLFVAPEHVEAVASRFHGQAFDMETGFWTHEGERCSFDKMLAEFGLETAPLMHLARIIRATDTGRLENAPEAAGLLAISLGLSRQHSDDLAQLEAGMIVYDALYRWCRDATDETHSWATPKKPTS